MRSSAGGASSQGGRAATRRTRSAYSSGGRRGAAGSKRAKARDWRRPRASTQQEFAERAGRQGLRARISLGKVKVSVEKENPGTDPGRSGPTAEGIGSTEAHAVARRVTPT